MSARVTHSQIRETILEFFPRLPSWEIEKLTNAIMIKFIGPLQDHAQDLRMDQHFSQDLNDSLENTITKEQRLIKALTGLIRNFASRGSWVEHHCQTGRHFTIDPSRHGPIEPWRAMWEGLEDIGRKV